jgi:hypothetical protein
VSWLSEVPGNAEIDVHQTRVIGPSKSLCKKAGTAVLGGYDAYGGKFYETPVVDCFSEAPVPAVLACPGRCGEGCGDSEGQPRHVQKLTQACLNHDICVHDLGKDHPECRNEQRKTAWDNFFATDCAELTGQWYEATLDGPGYWSFKQNGAALVGVTQPATHDPRCRKWLIEGTREASKQFLLRLTSKSEHARCCPGGGYNYLVTYQGCKKLQLSGTTGTCIPFPFTSATLCKGVLLCGD